MIGRIEIANQQQTNMKLTKFSVLVLLIVLTSCNARLRANETQDEHVKTVSSVTTSDLKSTTVDSLYMIEKIMFSSGSALTTAHQESKMKNVTLFLLENKNVILSIEGHTHCDGGESSNLTLSTQRAKAVYDFLINEDIDKDRMTYIGYGESRPYASNETSHGKSQNSRVEIIVIEE